MIERIFTMTCLICDNSTEYEINDNRSQNLKSYPRKGTCGKCGDTTFTAKKEIRVS